MRGLIRLPAILVVALLAGCHVHPLPYDVVRLEVHQILHQIRCEAAEAVWRVYTGQDLKGHLYAKLDEKTYPGQTLHGGERGYRILSARIEKAKEDIDAARADAKALNDRGDKIRARIALNTLRREKKRQDILQKVIEKEDIQDIMNEYTDRKNELIKAQRAYLLELQQIERVKTRYKIDKLASDTKSALLEKLYLDMVRARKKEYKALGEFLKRRFAYTVNLKSSEENVAGGNLSFKIPIFLGTVSIDQVDPTDDRERTADRTVKAVASFEELVDTEHCRTPKAPGVLVPRYPIEGKVGLAEVIQQYMKIIGGKTKGTLKAGKDTEGYTDKITFKTTISGGVSPKVTINHPAGHTFTGSLDLSGSRTEEHELNIGLTLEDESEDENDREKTTAISKVQIVEGSDF